MAFENHIIAAINNPNAVAAWREASRQHVWKMFHETRGASLEEMVDVLDDNVTHFQKVCEQTQKELHASREENRAVHEELGEAYEVSQSALTLASTYSEAYFQQVTRACRAESALFLCALCIFTAAGLQAIGAWGLVLLRLS